MPVEVVVVDSGSTDGTLDLVGAESDVLVEIPPAEFTFGGALNRGAAASSGEFHVALSSHCALPRRDWVDRALSHLRGGATAAFGETRGPGGSPLDGPRAVTHDELMANQWWGYTNHGSAWRADAWRREQFAEDLIASEDKEWSWRVTHPDGYLVADPALLVPAHHRRSAGVRAYYRRCIKELTALAQIRPLAPYPVSRALADLAAASPGDPYITEARRLGRTRAIEVTARWQAGRRSDAHGGGERCCRPTSVPDQE